MPDAAEGVINGSVALTVMPGVDSPNGEIAMQDPAGCEIHLVPENAKAIEMTWGCGEWFQPPAPGKHLLWIEKDGGISTVQQVLRYSEIPFEGKGSLTVQEFQAAGRIAVAPGTSVRGDSVRFVSFAANQNIRPFERRLPGRRAADSVRMPTGPAVAAIFDEAGNALAVSRPVQVKKGETAHATVTVPAPAKSHVVAVLAGFRDANCANVTLDAAGARRAADAVVRTHERVTAIWYDAAPGAGKIGVTCGADRQELDVKLAPGKIATIRQRVIMSAPQGKEKK